VQRSPRRRQEPLPPLFEHIKKPQVFLPVAVVVTMVVFAFAVQPGGSTTSAGGDQAEVAIVEASETPTELPSPTNTPTAIATTRGQTPPATSTTTDDVAGARSTPEATPTPAEDFSRTATECGAIQETAVPLSVEQTINGVAIRATRASAYPIEYFRCILMATGGSEAVALASSVSKAQNAGSTHAILVDLWITNASREFGQLNLKSSSVAAAGQQFAPLATLGGRAEVVISSGQGRNITLVVAVTNDVGETTGPVTLTVDAPLVGGKQQQGKYQLFLPTP
jgi:hypothetical protein